MARRTGLLVAVLALVAAACGSDTDVGGNAEVAAAVQVAPAASSAPAAAEPAAEPAPAPDQGDGDGIEVHGHWTIEVRNPDGSLDQRVEFENALTANGAVSLATLLGTPRSYVQPGLLVIRGIGTGELFDEAVPNECSRGCFFDPVSHATEGATVVVVGNGTATVSGQLDAVRTTLNVTAGPGGTNTSGPFTEKTLDSPVPFVEGQEIEITVEISFS